LAAARQLTLSFQNNVERTEAEQQRAQARSQSGLSGSVDLSLANAEKANALILVLQAKDRQKEAENQLIQMLGIAVDQIQIDENFRTKTPGMVNLDTVLAAHPQLQFYHNRVVENELQTTLFRRLRYPSIQMVALAQSRGSGFGFDLIQQPQDFNRNYWSGIRPNRSNYLLGIGLSWNFMETLRISRQIKTQTALTNGLQQEYKQLKQALEAQHNFADYTYQNALQIQQLAPIQVHAARAAYQQQSVLYAHGLSSMVELSQSLYALIRAETDQHIAQYNLWQALLLIAAAQGDYELFRQEI